MLFVLHGLSGTIFDGQARIDVNFFSQPTVHNSILPGLSCSGGTLDAINPLVFR
jgi:hypothetical protein